MKRQKLTIYFQIVLIVILLASVVYQIRVQSPDGLIVETSDMSPVKPLRPPAR